MEYKILKENFTRKGFTYKLIKRDKDKAIYEQKRSKKNITYEVIKIRRHNGYTIGGVYIEPAEVYPSANEWGDYGWTFNDLTRAEEKYKTL